MAIFKKKVKNNLPKSFVSEPLIRDMVKDQNEIVFANMNLRERESNEKYLKAVEMNKVAKEQQVKGSITKKVLV
jgi:hypothetical protein